MSLDRELQAIAVHPKSRTQQARQFLEKMGLRRRRHAAYAKAFLDEHGDLTPAGKIVLADLAEFANLGMAAGRLSDADLRAMEGRRAVVLRLIDSLHMDDVRLARMARQFREMQDE